MKKLQYLVRVKRDVGSDWGASVPDLPGCVATGKTLDVVMRRIQAAIQLHVRGLREDGDPVPRPRHRVVRPTRSAKQVDFYATVEVAASLPRVPPATHPNSWTGKVLPDARQCSQEVFPMPTLLDLELLTFEAMRLELLGRVAQKFVLIKGDQLVDMFECQADALKCGYETFGNQPFLVKMWIVSDDQVRIRGDEGPATSG